MKAWTGLAALITLMALAFLITAASVASWTEVEADQTVTEYGPYRVCRVQNGVPICKRVSDDCDANFGGTGGMGTVTVGDSCNKVRAVRAFLIISIILAALSFVAFWIAAHSVDPAWMSRMLGVTLAFLSAISGIITMAIWISLQTNTGDQHPTDRQYGYAFALLIAAWVALLLSACMSMMPSPADLADTSAGHTIAGGMSRMLGGRAGAPHYAGGGYTGGAPAGSAAAV